MRLSIIVPLYNIEDYITDCLEKISEISDDSIEVIVVNDGSTDSSVLKVEAFKDRIKNLVIINQENGGVCVARNTGISTAKGEYIYLCDGDDFICPNQFQELVRRTIENNLEIGIGNGKYLYDNHDTRPIIKPVLTSQLGKTTGPHFFKSTVLSGEFNPTVWLIIVKKDFLINNQIYFTPMNMHEDEEFITLCYAKAKDVQFWDLDIYRYRQRAGSLTKPKDHRYLSPRTIPSYLGIISKFHSLYKESNQDEVKEVYLIGIMRSYLAICRRLKFRAKKQFISEYSNFKDLNTAPFNDLPLKYSLPIWKMRARIWSIQFLNKLKRTASVIISLAF